MKTVLVPDVGTDLTVADLESLPKLEGYDYELDEGRLRIVAAAAMRNWHGDMAFRVTAYFRARGQAAFPEAGIIVRDRTTRTPDVGVLWERPPTSGKAYHPGSAYSTVIEIISPDSEDDDRLIKPRLYAEVGVPTYWLVERHPEDEWDGLVKIHQLTPAGYVVTRTVPLSELETES